MESEEPNGESLLPADQGVLEPAPPGFIPVQPPESGPVQAPADPPQIIKIPQQASAQAACQVRKTECNFRLSTVLYRTG